MFRTSVLAVIAVLALLATGPHEANALGRRHVPLGTDVVLYVDDPCDFCGPLEVCLRVPCCCTEPPTVCWRDGIFGRRVATYVWHCCGYSVDVVVTRRGTVVVRG